MDMGAEGATSVKNWKTLRQKDPGPTDLWRFYLIAVETEGINFSGIRTEGCRKNNVSVSLFFL